MPRLEDEPMLPPGKASDEEAAYPSDSKGTKRGAGKNRNAVLFVMWRIIWLLAATSVIVLLIYAPWPGRTEGSGAATEGMMEDVSENVDMGGPGDAGGAGEMHKSMGGGSMGDTVGGSMMDATQDKACCNSTTTGKDGDCDGNEDYAALPTE